MFSWMNVWCVTSNVHCSSSALFGQLAVQQQVGDLEERRLLGQLLDRVAAVAQDAGVAVEVGDRRLAGRGLHVRRVVDEQVGVELTNRRRRKDAVGDRNGDGLAGSIVGDGDGVGHVASFVSRACCETGLSPRAVNVPPGRFTAPTRGSCTIGSSACSSARRLSRRSASDERHVDADHQHQRHGGVGEVVVGGGDDRQQRDQRDAPAPASSSVRP